MRNPQPFVEIDGAPYVAWWNERFAPPDEPFRGLRFYQRGHSNIWVGRVELAGLAALRTDAIGIHLMRIGRRLWKPTSAAIVAFAGGATANSIDLDRAEAARFLGGEMLLPDDDDPRRAGLTSGFIAVRTGGIAIGCGEWRRGALQSCIPKSQRLPDPDM